MKDPILELIVKFSEAEEPLETGITLVVDGFLVSGHIISKENYMTHNALTSQIEEAITEVFSKKASEETEPDDDGVRNFIHLRDAKYFLSGQNPIPGTGTVYCRIPLEKVSGFTLGTLGVAEESR